MVLLWSGHLQTSKEGEPESGGGSESGLLVSVWADPLVPVLAVPVLRQGFHLSCVDSGGEHLCSEEVRRGFLRPSLEETLAFDRSRSVEKEEVAEVVGSYQIWFLMFSFCFSFVFLLFYTLICFCFSFVAR